MSVGGCVCGGGGGGEGDMCDVYVCAMCKCLCVQSCLSVHHVVCVYMQGASVVSGVSFFSRRYMLLAYPTS